MLTVFSFFFLTCIIITVVGYYFRRKWAKQRILDRQGVLKAEQYSKLITIKDILNDPYIPNIKWQDIKLDKRIGRGASGLVWSAKWNRYYFFVFVLNNNSI